MIPIMNLIEKLKEEKVGVSSSLAKVMCRVFDDNSGSRTIATMQKFRPMTKHINNKYWPFKEHLEKGYILIDAIKSKDQLADILTKPLPETIFVSLRYIIMRRVSSSNTSAFEGSVINSEDLKAVNAESAVEMSASHENVWHTRLYEKSKMDAALYNAVDDHDGTAIPAQWTRVDKS